MKDKTNFSKKFITSIYDLKVFSDYAKEGLLSAIIYALLIASIFGGLKGIFTVYRINNKVSKINQELRPDKYNLSIENGILNIKESPIKLQAINNSIYIDDNIYIEDADSLKSIIANDDVNILILKDGVILNNSINNYKIYYNDILKGITLDGSELINEIRIFRLILSILTVITFIISTFFELLINCLIVVLFTYVVSVFMKMIVKYSAMYSLALYASTLPLIIKIILEIINPNVNLDNVFIIGTLIYVIFILSYIKYDIIEKLNNKRAR